MSYQVKKSKVAALIGLFLTTIGFVGRPDSPTEVVPHSGPELVEMWSQPVEPFRIAGNLYYVGAHEVTSFLLVGSEGHVLIDGGLPQTAPLIKRNIEALGFSLADVTIILNSHAHVDHAGGLAWLREKSGARVAAMRGDVPTLKSGRLFPAVQVDRVLEDLDVIRVGEIELQAHLTPGHTPGCTTWTTRIRGDEGPLDVVFVGSPNALPQHDFIAEPDLQHDFIETFTRLRSLPVDIFLASHGSFFHLSSKRSRLISEPAEEVFIDREGYERFLERKERQFLQEVDAQIDQNDEVRV